MLKPNSISALVMIAALPCFAQWQLIDDFQQWEDGDIFLEAEDIGWNASAPDQTDEYWMMSDPFAPGNIAMYVECGIYGTGGRTFVLKALPGGGIGPGETGTLFFRCFFDSLHSNWHIATADKQLAFDDITGLQITPGDWEDLNALIRLGAAGALEHRDGNSYITTNPPLFPQTREWYSFWMVVENTWDMTTSPPTCTGTHTLYVQGDGFGDSISPVLIPVGTDPPKYSASLRRAPVDDEGNPKAVIWAVYATTPHIWSSPSTGDVFLLDDFYFSPGLNLTDPGPAGGGDPLLRYGGYGINNPARGDVDTGNWLDWLNVSEAPYIWSYALNGWIYMEEPAADAPGAWGYFYK